MKRGFLVLALMAAAVVVLGFGARSAKASESMLAHAGGPYSGAPGQAIQFNGSASGGNIVDYSWRFSDGTTAAGVTASKAFSAAGTYNATLVVTDGLGQSMSAVAQVVVGDGYYGGFGYGSYPYYGGYGYVIGYMGLGYGLYGCNALGSFGYGGFGYGLSNAYGYGGYGYGSSPYGAYGSGLVYPYGSYGASFSTPSYSNGTVYGGPYTGWGSIRSFSYPTTTVTGTGVSYSGCGLSSYCSTITYAYTSLPTCQTAQR